MENVTHILMSYVQVNGIGQVTGARRSIMDVLYVSFKFPLVAHTSC